MDERRRWSREAAARGLFQAWLMTLDDGQLSALVVNWDNVMDDAALDRVDSWVITGNALAYLRSGQDDTAESERSGDTE